MGFKHADVTEIVIAAFYEVYNTLGYGFSESVYHAAMVLELRDRGMEVDSERPIGVLYKGRPTAQFFADLVVNDCVVVELKSAKELIQEHEAQLLNYLRATPFEVGLLMNFGPQAQFIRKAYENSRKGGMTWVATRHSQGER